MVNLLPAVSSGPPMLDVIHHVDALNLLRALPAASIDLIFIDPPYNTTNLAFEVDVDWRAFWQEARRVLKTPNHPALIFSQQPFTTDLINSNRRGFRYEIILHKSMPTGFLDANRRPLRCHENLLVFADAMPRYSPIMAFTAARRYRVRSGNRAAHYGDHGGTRGWQDSGSRYPRSVWDVAQRDTAFGATRTLHPTQKPLDAVRRAIQLYSQPGEIVLDCFAGSGTTAVAARSVGRYFIIGDNDPACVATARQRLASSDPFGAWTLAPGVIQPSLFSQEA